mgnify:CR=1 FL=1
MPAHGFQKSENLFFTEFFLPVYIFGRRQAKNGDGKKNMGCKKNSGVKKVIARPRFPTKICLQITIIFTCALTHCRIMSGEQARGSGLQYIRT